MKRILHSFPVSSQRVVLAMIQCLASLILLHLPSARVFGDGPPLQFAKIAGDLFGHAVASDSKGNIYIGTGYENAALVKYDPNGNFLWSFGQEPNTPGVLAVRGIIVDPSDDIYVYGYLSCWVTAGKIKTEECVGGSTFFAKFTPNGSNLFAKIFYGLNAGYNAFAQTEGEGFLVAGRYSRVTYEGITITADNPSVLVFKIKGDGSPVWYRRGTGDSSADGIVASPDGTVLFTVSSDSSTFGMAGLIASNVGSKNSYLIELDSEGSGLWTKSVASSRDGDFGFSAVTFSRKANAFIWAGDFTESLKLVSPAITSRGGKDVFVSKISGNGTVLWARTFGGAQDQFAKALIVDDAGNIYVAGYFFGTMTIGPSSLTSLGLRDLFVAKFRDDGTPLWGKRMGWTDNDYEVSLAFTPAGELLVTGTVRGGASIDGKYLEGVNSSDGFIAKFYPEDVPPRFRVHPGSQVVTAGMTFTLSSELAINDPSVSLQWWFNGAPLEGQTKRTLTIANVTPQSAGSYYVVARNEAGSATSASALISYTDASALILSVHPSLTIFGTPGKTYRIEYATETGTAGKWTFAENVTLASSPEVWIDPTAATGKKRFYRVTLVE